MLQGNRTLSHQLLSCIGIEPIRTITAYIKKINNVKEQSIA